MTLAFGGDVHVEGRLTSLVTTDGLAALQPVLGGADVAVVNLETAITDRGVEQPKIYHFRTTPEALVTLQHAGVDAVSMANNHAVDYGPDGLTDTLAAQASSPIPVIGIGPDAAKAFAPAVFQVRAPVSRSSPRRRSTTTRSTRTRPPPRSRASPGTSTTRGCSRPSGPRAPRTTSSSSTCTGAVTTRAARTAPRRRLPPPSRRPEPTWSSAGTPTGCRARAGSAGRTWPMAWETSSGSTPAGRSTPSAAFSPGSVDPARAHAQRGAGPSVVAGAAWTPLLIGDDGVPRPPEAAAAASQQTAWVQARSCARLASTP